MALVICTECKTEISDTASVCPKCGAPRKPKKKTSIVTWLIAGIAGLWLIGYMMTLQRQQEEAPARAAAALMKDQIASKLKLDFEWHRTGFETVLELNAKVANSSDHDIRDFTVACSGAGASGTNIDKVQKTFYESVRKGETKKFPALNMGFLNSQVKSIGCKITDFVLI